MDPREENNLKNSEKSDDTHSRRISKRGLIFGFTTLVFNGMQPVVSNTRPDDLNTMLFTFWVITIELALLLIVFGIYKIYTKRKRIIPKRLESALEGNIPDMSSENTRIDNELTLASLNKWNVRGRLLLIGFIFSISTYMVFLGYKSVDNVTGAIAVKTQPISMLIIGAIFLKEKITSKELISAAIMLLSVYYISTKGTMKMGEFTSGIIFLFLAPLLWNIGHALTKRLFDYNILSVPQLILIRLVLSSIFTLIMLIIIFPEENLRVFEDERYIPSIFGMATVYFVLHLAWYRTIKEIDVGLATSMIIPAPLVTAFLAYFITDERLYYYHFIGLIGTLIGLYGLLFFKSKKKK